MIPAQGFCCAVDWLKMEVDAEACEKAPPTENFRSKVLRSHDSKNLPKPAGEDLVSGPQYVSYVEGSKVRCITVLVRHDPLCPFPHPVPSCRVGGGWWADRMQEKSQSEDRETTTWFHQCLS